VGHGADLIWLSVAAVQRVGWGVQRHRRSRRIDAVALPELRRLDAAGGGDGDERGGLHLGYVWSDRPRRRAVAQQHRAAEHLGRAEGRPAVVGGLPLVVGHAADLLWLSVAGVQRSWGIVQRHRRSGGIDAETLSGPRR